MATCLQPVSVRSCSTGAAPSRSDSTTGGGLRTHCGWSGATPRAPRPWPRRSPRSLMPSTAPGVDSDPVRHARTYRDVLTGAGLDEDLVAALYAVESDVARNPFALDVESTLAALQDAGVGVAVVSDIHVDLRPVFVAAGLDPVVSVYSLSFELGVQKPDPVVFTRTLDALGVPAQQALMVGDRSRPDGGVVEVGITTLLLPPLRTVHERRLHTVLQLCGIAAS